KSIQIKGNEIHIALSHTLFSTAPYSETRPELQGVYIHSKNTTTLSFITTDTYRLSYYSLSLSSPTTVLGNCIIPLQTLTELQKIISSYIGEPVVISRNETQIQFTCGSVQMISKLIHGTFPDYENIVPKNFSTSIILERDETTKAVRAASLFSKGGLYDVLFRIHPKEQGKGEVEILSSNTLLGENSVVLEGEVRGIENSILLNYRYLIDWLQVIDSEKIMIQIIDATTACVLRGLGRENEYYLLMPILE
ncbi:DNA polymerase III subunit beta, partial [Candidatus Uhrbacteria bacterium]|nr:DNA polymerase III subunit beta [Candidatus Uhrbacteria bacterium]